MNIMKMKCANENDILKNKYDWLAEIITPFLI